MPRVEDQLKEILPRVVSKAEQHLKFFRKQNTSVDRVSFILVKRNNHQIAWLAESDNPRCGVAQYQGTTTFYRKRSDAGLKSLSIQAGPMSYAIVFTRVGDCWSEGQREEIQPFRKVQ